MCTDNLPPEPWIVSFNVNEKSCLETSCKYLLNITGGEYLGHLSWRLTPEEGVRGDACDVIYPSYELREVLTKQWQTVLNITVPHVDGKIYFCLMHSVDRTAPFGGKWIHQGADLYLEPKIDERSHTKNNNYR